MKTCLIISGGEFSPIAEHIEYDYVIACDMGYEHSKRLGIKPDLLMGDFDSIRDASSPFPEDISLMSYPKEKDDTDTMLAVKCSLDKGFRHLIIICGLGGRMDHSIANIQTMAYAAKKGALCELYSEKEYIRTFSGGKLALPKREGYSLSLFSLTDECSNLSIKGSKYETDSISLHNIFPLGVSNSWASDSVEITMDEGILLIIESKMS